MIVPLGIKFDTKAAEDEDFDLWRLVDDMSRLPRTRFAFQVGFFDTSTSEARILKLRAAEVDDVDPMQNVGLYLRQHGIPSDGSLGYLRQLRDEIDRILEDKS